jgi:2-oxoglutarate dehydrogenase E2 component (dihydrolipoamide succinyltransferase)
MIDVTLPQLGESVTEGTISKWLVGEGDVVKKDQPLVEIATDKADAEVPSPVTGRIVKLLANVGEVVPVKSALCQVEEGAFEAASAPASASKETSVPPPPKSGATLAPSKSATGAALAPSKSATGAALAQPTVRKAALEKDVDLSQVRGTGDNGRITKDDVLRASAPAQPSGAASKVTGAAVRAGQVAELINQGGGFVPPIPGRGYGSFKVPAYREAPGDKVVPFTRRRRITADHMAYSKVVSPHVVTVAEIDLYKASRLRELHKERYKKEGLSLTMLAFVVSAAARALRETPDLNARVLEDAYVQLREINIGVAVDSPDGLVVPVVRRADELGVRGIVRSIDDVAKRARAGKITIDDLSGATFSVTNPGLKGNLFGGAIISQPNVGILRMGEINKRVVVVEGPEGEDQMAIHPVMYMALSYDHRIVDGVAANSFLWRVTEIVEKSEFDV